jgi:tetratricopeptide (TPR) repeat protein
VPKLFAAFCAIACLSFISGVHAADAAPQLTPIHWQYKLGDVVVTNTDTDGKATHALNMDVVDYFLDTIAGRVDQYPIRFTSNAEQIDVTDKLRRLTALLSELDAGASVNLDILRREAFAYNLAFDMGFPEASEKTDGLYQRLLKQTPDEPAANYLYGAFLAASDNSRAQSIPYLEKAAKLGVKKANYTLGVAYIAMGKDQQALGYLQQYSADFPDDQRVKSLIAAVKSGDIHREYHP